MHTWHRVGTNRSALSLFTACRYQHHRCIQGNGYLVTKVQCTQWNYGCCNWRPIVPRSFYYFTAVQRRRSKQHFRNSRGDSHARMHFGIASLCPSFATNTTQLQPLDGATVYEAGEEASSSSRTILEQWDADVSPANVLLLHLIDEMREPVKSSQFSRSNSLATPVDCIVGKWRAYISGALPIVCFQ